jgi:hypothetical protein
MERFDNNFLGFYNDVRTIVPELFEKKESSEDKSVCLEIILPESPEARLDFFVNNWYPHMDAVSSAVHEYFTDHNPLFFPGLSFNDLMPAANEKNKQTIWEYLHTLFALSISTKKVRENFSELEEKKEDETEEDFVSRKAHFEMVAKTIEDFPVLIGNMVSWKREKQSEEKKANPEPSQVPPVDEKFLENSSLTKLAQEISNEINPEDIMNLESGIEDPAALFKQLLSGDSDSGIGKLMKTVTDKLKNKMESGEVNQQDLFRDANILLQNLGQQAPGQGASGEGPAGGGPAAPNFSNIMSMAQNLASLGDLFGSDMPGSRPHRPPGRNRNNVPSGRRHNRKFKRKMKRAVRKAEKKKEQEESRGQSHGSSRSNKSKSSKSSRSRKVHRRKKDRPSEDHPHQDS